MMRVRPTDPTTAAGLIDPDTKRSPFIDATTGKPLENAVVPSTNFWIRRLQAGEIAEAGPVERADQSRAAPTGLEPVTPLTTR